MIPEVCLEMVPAMILEEILVAEMWFVSHEEDLVLKSFEESPV